MRIYITVFQLMLIASTLASGSALADKEDSPKEVIVVNESAQPIPVTVQGTLNVDVQTQSSVDINSMPDVTINDSVPLDVNITNLPPAESREAVTLVYGWETCEASSRPNSFQISWEQSGGTYCGFNRIYADGTASPADTAWLIPPNKTLVITDVTFNMSIPFDTDRPMATMNGWLFEGGASGPVHIVFSAIAHNRWPGFSGLFSGELHFETGFHAQDETTLLFKPEWVDSVRPSIQGYLIDTP